MDNFQSLFKHLIMNSEEQLKFCKKCDNQKNDSNHVVICGLTNRSPSFIETCEFFIESTDDKDNLATITSEMYILDKTASLGKRFAKRKLDIKRKANKGTYTRQTV